LHLVGRLEIPTKADTAGSEPTADKFRVLLGTPSGPLVTRVTNDELWHNGQILVVANGSFLLNYPLVNHEHRKLATRLVNACGPDKKVLFLESGPGGPAVLDKEPASGPVTAFELLQVWPLNAILLHLTVLGIVFCLSQAAIFGRPRELPPEPTADFGKHVAAMGQLLARTGDRHYAQARITQYRQFAERKSGRSHLKSK
jgi:hypothetical protein